MTYTARLRITNDKCNPQCVLTDAFNFVRMREWLGLQKKMLLDFTFIYLIIIDYLKHEFPFNKRKKAT